MNIEPLSNLGRSESGPQAVTRAIRQAAQQSGLDFDLMLGVAQRESSLQADAKASTSSASGLFQFIDQTWLGALKQHGEELGLGDVANDITRGANGYTVADPDRRQEILDLRFDPEVSAGVAGKTLAGAKDRLAGALGRAVSASEVYMTHFLGERGAQRMLAAGDNALAADVDPRAAGANQPLFYEGGRALSVAEFRDKIALHLGTEPAPQLGSAPDVQVPYRPTVAEPTSIPPRAPISSPVVADSYARPASVGTEITQRMPPQLYATIVEMQSDFILGRSDDS